MIKKIKVKPKKLVKGEVRSKEELNDILGGSGLIFDPYILMVCNFCDKKFKFRMDSIEIHFQTCSHCGFVNGLEGRKDAQEIYNIRECFENIREGLEKYSRLGPYTIPIYD